MFKRITEILECYKNGQNYLGQKCFAEYLAGKPKEAIDDFCVIVAMYQRGENPEFWVKAAIRDFFKEIQREEKYCNLFLKLPYYESIRNYLYIKIL